LYIFFQRYIFPSYLQGFRFFFGGRGLRIIYTRSDRSGFYYRYPSYTSNSYTISRIPINVTVNATITAQGRFFQYGCYNSIMGSPSEMASATSVEKCKFNFDM